MKDPRIFALICVVLGGMGQGVVSPKLPLILGESSELALAAGASAALLYLGIFLSTFAYGKWADAGKVHRLLGPGLLVYALTLVLLGTFHSVGPLLAVRFLEGLALSAVFVATDFILGRLSRPDERGRWLSYYGVALSIGLLLGPAVALGFERWGSWGDRPASPLYAVAFVSVLLGGLALKLRIARAADTTVASTRLNRSALTTGAVYGYMEAALVAVFPVLAVTEFHVVPEYCLFVVILSAALSSVIWGTLADSRGARPVLFVLLGLLLSGPLAILALHGLASNAQVAYASSALFGVLAGGIYPVGFTWLLESLPEAQYGFASGSFARAYGLGSLIGPAAAGIAAQAFGSGGLFASLAIGGAIGLVSIVHAEKQR